MKEFVNDKEALDTIVRKGFDKIAVEERGFLNLKKLESIIIRISTDLGLEPPKQPEIEKVIKGLDTEKEGFINYEKFFELIQKILLSLINNEAVDENDDNIDI